jgi:malonyl-CoA/methylmalonyl-CoA synthetase
MSAITPSTISSSSFTDTLRKHSRDKVALVQRQEQYTYGQVNDRADEIAAGLLALSSNNNKTRNDLQEERIALYLSASWDYVTAVHGVWRAGGLVVPLHVETTVATTELEYYLTNARVTRVIISNAQASCQATNGSLQPLCQRLGIELLSLDSIVRAAAAHLNSADTATTIPNTITIDASRRAMILFTSGTTSKPKGVVTTHQTIRAQITSLVTAWTWTREDVIPLFLPLHHIHGIINVLSCALYAGAKVHLFPKFHVDEICRHVAAHSYTLFMAVPTIYVKLLQYLDTQTGHEFAHKRNICEGFRAMRLNVSGSAACPVTLFETWQLYTGQVLLERYGMTEIGMALSNPYQIGPRQAGSVGQPLPGVQVQLFDESSSSLPIVDVDVPGEIRVKGDSVFLEYWDNAEATRNSFKDGWFCTGDIAVLEPEWKYYKIMGRSSIDIIKSGGYKLSALEIEGVLLTHSQIAEVAVIGVPDDTWGQIVVAFICLKQDAATTPFVYQDLKAWCQDKMSSYKIPKQIKVLGALPRNAMGKVTKPLLQTMAQV